MTDIPQVNYDADNKVWIGDELRAYFSKDLSIGEIIFNEMQRHPKLIAQVSDSEKTILTRQQLLLNSKRVAKYLRNLALQQTDIVGIMARNTTHISSVAYGCFFNGIAFHSLNIHYEPEMITKLFDMTKPKIIFCDGDEYEKVKVATEKLNVKIVTMRNHKEGSITIDEVLSTPTEESFQPQRLKEGNNQTLAILCTSGTTGVPKASLIPNSLILINTCSFVNTSDVMFMNSTLDWLTGLIALLIAGIRSPQRIISDKDFDPSDILQIINNYKVSTLFQVPSHMAQMANCPDFKEARLDSLLHYIFGADSCSIEVQQRIHSKLSPKCKFLFAYTCTEMCLGGTMNFHYDRKPNSVGRVTEGCKMKILNEQGESLGPHKLGEVCLHTGIYWAGYYGNPEETRKMQDKDMWYHTGDIGYVDQDGFLYLVDRKKAMLKYQAIMYYPYEIETVIHKMPEVSEVCVFGIWHPLNGDEAAAAVVKKIGVELNAQHVIDFVAKQVKSKYLQLHGGVFIIDDLKRNSNGKADRRATKEYCLKIA